MIGLRLTGVAVRRSGREILRGIDAEVPARSLTAIVGPNGAGKSSMLAVLSGDLRPAEGRVELNGVPLADWSVRDAARQRAVMLQSSPVPFAFEVREVVAMARNAWQGTPQQADDAAAVDDAIARAGLESLAGRDVTTLSGGEGQRVSFARCLAQRTPVLLLDEPIAAMDLRHAEHTMQICRELADGGAAIAVVLHDLAVAAAYCDRALLLHEGAVVAQGPTREVLRADLLSEVYGLPIEVRELDGELLINPHRAR